MPLAPGDRFGAYEITARLGAGGMGEVYRAHDTRLGRDVAIKVLPDAFARDAERLARFEREARLISHLNHPNICALYHIGDAPDPRSPLSQPDSIQFLVLELVEGPTLADRIAQGPLPLDEALPIARQIADALEAAHEQGIVHRDLKPANIKLTADGKVKVLDFGLAKALDKPDAGRDLGSAADLSHSPTLTSPAMTARGVILGTAAYMSPEQARGKAVDKRTDLWAFGCVLYEMLTGTAAFKGDGVSDTIAEVLKSEPDWRPMAATLPDSIGRLLRRCLAKDPRSRISDAGVARLEIDEALNPAAPSAATATSAAGPAKPARLAWGVAVASLLIAAGAVAVSRYGAVEPPPPPTGRFTVPIPSGSSMIGLSSVVLAMSPDGRHIAYNSVASAGPGRGAISIRSLDSFQPRPVPGATEGAYFPFWSPDSAKLGFFFRNTLQTVALAGGALETVSDAPDGVGGSWNREGVILFGQWSGGIQQVAAGGGEPTAATALRREKGGPGHVFPQFLPDGRRFIYFARPANEVHLASLDSSETRKLFDADAPAQYVQPGYLLFVRQGTLMTQPFDAARGELTGSPVQIATQIAVIPGVSLAEMSASDNGVLTYRSLAGVPRPASKLVWMSREGHKNGEIAGVFDDRLVSLAQSAPFIALDRFENATSPARDIWLVDHRRGTSSKLTSGTFDECCPIVSPDGRRIIFSSNRDGQRNLYETTADALEPPKLLLKAGADTYPKDWSRDSRFIAFEQGRGQGRDLWVLPLFGERTPIAVARTPADESGGRISPDGRRIAYVSNQSGRYEVYVQSLAADGRRRLQVSTSSGFYPRWRGDGREIYYVSADRKLMSVTVDDRSDDLQLGLPTPLFDLPISDPTTQQFTDKYDVTADGQRFIVLEPLDQRSSIELTVMMNWMTGLKN